MITRKQYNDEIARLIAERDALPTKCIVCNDLKPDYQACFCTRRRKGECLSVKTEFIAGDSFSLQSVMTIARFVLGRTHLRPDQRIDAASVHAWSDLLAPEATRYRVRIVFNYYTVFNCGVITPGPAVIEGHCSLDDWQQPRLRRAWLERFPIDLTKIIINYRADNSDAEELEKI